MTNSILCSIILFLFSLNPIPLKAVNTSGIIADPFPDDQQGQYVYYHDMRRGVYGNSEPVNRLIGILKADNKQYIIHVCSLSDGKSYLYLGNFILEKGKMEFSTVSIQGDTKEAAPILGDLLNLMSFMGAESLKHSVSLKNKNEITVPVNWADYSRKLTGVYKWWIPFYRLDSLSNAADDSFDNKGYASLKLICFGSVSESDPDFFTRIRKLPVFIKTSVQSDKYRIKPDREKKVMLDNVLLTLDENWRFEKGDPLSGIEDSWWLKKYTDRDARLGVESIDAGNIKIGKTEIEAFTGSLKYQSCVIADSVNIDYKNRSLSLMLWDADQETATFTKYVSLGVDRKLLTMVSFSAFDFIYYSNIEYFNSILNAISR